MNRYWPVLLAALLPAPALANCITPWRMEFACDIVEKNTRAEFCRIEDTDKYPDLKEAYYTYADASGRTQLYFQADTTLFSTKDTVAGHPTDLTMAVGYPRGNYVYAFVITEDSREPDGVRDAEVRVYSSADAFTNETRDTQITTLYCKPASIIADLPNIRP